MQVGRLHPRKGTYLIIALPKCKKTEAFCCPTLSTKCHPTRIEVIDKHFNNSVTLTRTSKSPRLWHKEENSISLTIWNRWSRPLGTVRNLQSKGKLRLWRRNFCVSTQVDIRITMHQQRVCNRIRNRASIQANSTWQICSACSSTYRCCHAIQIKQAQR